MVRRIKDFTLVRPDHLDEGAVFDLEALVAEAIELTQPLLKPPFLSQKIPSQLPEKGRLLHQGEIL